LHLRIAEPPGSVPGGFVLLRIETLAPSNRRAIDALVLRNSGKPVPLQSVNFAKVPCEADGPSDESAFTRVFDALCRGRRG
jgi:hypothetical protein